MCGLPCVGLEGVVLFGAVGLDNTLGGARARHAARHDTETRGKDSARYDVPGRRGTQCENRSVSSPGHVAEGAGPVDVAADVEGRVLLVADRHVGVGAARGRVEGPAHLVPELPPIHHKRVRTNKALPPAP